MLSAAPSLDVRQKPLIGKDAIGEGMPTVVNGQYLLRMARSAPGASPFDYQHRAPTVQAGWSCTEIGFGFYRLTAPGVSLQQVQAWGKRAGVLYVEQDTLATISMKPNDPGFADVAIDPWGFGDGLWGLKRIGMEKAWDHGRGSPDVVVAVIDSGIDTNHPDLKANLWRNAGEVPGNGLDDDGNGYVDDVNGWASHWSWPSSGITDFVGHGTHVSGTIAAVGNNGIGVVGVGWNLKVMTVNAHAGGYMLGSLPEAYAYVIKQKLLGVNVAAINCSFSQSSYSQVEYDLVKLAGDAGIVVVAAAGNGGRDQIGDNNDRRPEYPCSYKLPNILSVAASEHWPDDRLSLFSNYGRSSVHLAAPGKYIRSTYPGGSYEVLSGTSMASPHVAGVVGLLKSLFPNATVAQIRQAILGSVDKSALLNGSYFESDQDAVASGGRLNAARAIEFMKLGARPQPTANQPSFTGTPDVAVTGGLVAEGHSGLRQLVFTITVSQPTARGTRVQFQTVNGSAVAGRDYVQASGVAFVQPNQRTATVKVMVNGNRIVDGNRSFSLRLSNATNGRIVVSTAVGTIYDDDGPGGIVFGAVAAGVASSAQAQATPQRKVTIRP